MSWPPTTSTRSDTLFPYPAVFRSGVADICIGKTAYWISADHVGNIGIILLLVECRCVATQPVAQYHYFAQLGTTALQFKIHHGVDAGGNGYLLGLPIGRAPGRESGCQ